MIPSPQQQVEFLHQVQRLLTEGLTTASYKYALLRALADLAVIKGDDSGAELELRATDLAEAFIGLYWRQVRPFEPPGLLWHEPPRVLRQNSGRQAGIARLVADRHAAYRGLLPRLKADAPAYHALIREVADIICAKPLWKLQRVGEEVTDFLYPNTGRGRSLRLRPGVAYCLRHFYGILRKLVEGAWADYLRSVNPDVPGGGDFGPFLFGAERANVEAYRPILHDAQYGLCFYCGAKLHHGGDLDHFIPWSRFPVDLGHNFVLAHRACNGRKREYLAAEPYLEAWLDRNLEHGLALDDYFRQHDLPGDWPAALSIARWAYGQTAAAGGMVWAEGDTLRKLEVGWEGMFSGGSERSSAQTRANAQRDDAGAGAAGAPRQSDSVDARSIPAAPDLAR